MTDNFSLILRVEGLSEISQLLGHISEKNTDFYITKPVNHMTLKEALEKYPGFTIYTDSDKAVKAGLRTEKFLKIFGFFRKDMKPVAIYLNKDRASLLYKRPDPMIEYVFMNVILNILRTI